MIDATKYIAATLFRVIALPIRVIGESLVAASAIYRLMAERIDPPLDELEFLTEQVNVEVTEHLPLWIESDLV